MLSPGVDPTDNLRKLADENGLQGKFFSVALGQGQAPVATRLIEDGVEQGFWVFLANCHLMTSWLPKLDKIIEDFGTKNVHEHGGNRQTEKKRPCLKYLMIKIIPTMSNMLAKKRRVFSLVELKDDLSLCDA